MSEAKAGQPPQTQSRQPGREYKMRPSPDYEPRYPGSGRLRGKVAVITGGDSGIGRAVSLLFAREGAKLAIVYKEEATDARKTASLVEDEGGEVLLIKGDVGKKTFCDKTVEKVVGRFGRIDVLVNNAAEQHVAEELPEITEKQLEGTFRTNIFGYIFMAQAALKHMRRGGVIVNTASVTAYRGSPQLVDYSSTKGAIVAFTRSLSGQLADKGIRVNAVAQVRSGRHSFRRASTRSTSRSSERTYRSVALASRTKLRQLSSSSPATIPPTSRVRCCIRMVARWSTAK
jgi:NAD(P)-dependent dehydrogenase (short-subunit alcohol dehydrogenase family)